MNSEGLDENTLEFGEEHFGEGEEVNCGAEDDRGTNRVKEMPIDRLGELPDSLLIHILSFLNVKEAAITCVLSKRWEHLWAELPSLEFRDGLLREVLLGSNNGGIHKVFNFVRWVNRALAKRTVNYLEKFDVSFIYHECFSSHVDAWVEFAVQNNVKILDLYMHFWDDLYRLPQLLYSCPSLTRLSLKGCVMDLETVLNWQCLTHLCLHEVDVDQSLLDEIFVSCPVLYDMELEGCCGFDCLEVNSRSIRRLTVVDAVFDDPLLKMSAPYVHRLYISLLMVGRRLQLGNISSLVRVDIDYDGCSWESSSVEVMSGAEKLLESVQHVKELYVGMKFIEVVSMMAVNGWQLPQSRRELLTVSCRSEYEHSISGIIGLLESSPNLETLVIEGDTEGEDVNLDPEAKDDLAGDLLHLKTVKIRNYADSKGEPLLTLARILLKRATTLEEMMIITNAEDLGDFTEMAQTMLTYPRSSTKAVVHLIN